MRILGVVLIVLGAIGLAIKGFSYTTEETIVDIGPIEASAEQQETVPIPVWLSGIVLAAGVVLLVMGKRSNV